MPAILTSNASVIAAENFITAIHENDSNLYLGVGRGYDDRLMNQTDDTAAEDGKYDDYNRWTDEYTPPTPRDTLNDVTNFLENLIGIKKIAPANMMLVVPRNDWAPGKKYEVLNPAAVAGKRAQNYYCLTSDERGNNNVWVCIGKTESAGGSTVEPSLAYRETAHEVAGHEIGYHYVANNTVRCNDGYTWLFLYNITTTMINAGLLLENWMPVPYNHHGVYGGSITETQDLYGDMNANRTLGAYRVLVTCTLGDEGDAIPYSSIYRQIGLLMDPRSSTLVSTGTGVGSHQDSGTDLDSPDDDAESSSQYQLQGARLTGEKYPASLVDTRYGTTEMSIANPVQCIFLENKKSVFREESQTEKLVMILVF
jgi:hypothetical protein